jgi:hypothetical protein
MAMKNPFKWALTTWQNRPRSPGKVVPFPAQQGQGVLPVGSNGQIVSPHEFLQAQIINLPDEEESVQKRTLLAIAYFLVTWGGSVIMILLGIGLALDLQTVFHITGTYALALTVLFPFGEFVFEILAILVGERIHQGIRSGGDAAFVFTFGPFVLLANTGTAMLQVFLFGWHNASEASIASLILWFRAFLPLIIVIGTIGVVAGIQRRSIRRMINALNRKAEALTSVAEASVHFLEADMNARRAIDEHEDARRERERKEQAFNEMQVLMRAAFDKMMERLNRLDDDDRNGRRMRL